VPRLHSSDLEVLGPFLFGPRWQRPLARALRRSDRLVRYWKSGQRPVIIAASARIEELVCSKHGERMRWLHATYLDMIAGLSDSAIRVRLLAMDLKLHLDNQLPQRALIEADLATSLAARTPHGPLATIPPTNSSAALVERITVTDLHSLCSASHCALRAAAGALPCPFVVMRNAEALTRIEPPLNRHPRNGRRHASLVCATRRFSRNRR
jgi:hypothetical protein